MRLVLRTLADSHTFTLRSCLPMPGSSCLSGCTQPAECHVRTTRAACARRRGDRTAAPTAATTAARRDIRHSRP